MKIKHDSQGPRLVHECSDCKPQHTPEPWKQNTPKGSEIIASFGANDICIAVAYGPSGEWDTVGAEHEANAALIASAPELLHFVKEVKRIADDGLLTPEWAKMAKALIAKAEAR